MGVVDGQLPPVKPQRERKAVHCDDQVYFTGQLSPVKPGRKRKAVHFDDQVQVYRFHREPMSSQSPGSAEVSTPGTGGESLLTAWDPAEQRRGCDCPGGVCMPETCSCALEGVECNYMNPSKGTPCRCRWDCCCSNPYGRVSHKWRKVQRHYERTFKRLRTDPDSFPTEEEEDSDFNEYDCD